MNTQTETPDPVVTPSTSPYAVRDYPRSWPLPNDRLTEGDAGTVIASVVLTDDTPETMTWLVLVLNPSPPFYTVAEIGPNTYVEIGSDPNIVPAVERYTENGGDY